MTGVSDQYVTIGNEAVAWGTRAATLTRLIEATPNKASHRAEYRPTNGMRPGFLGKAADRQRIDLRGGTYPLAFDLLNKSHSLALATLGQAPAITTPGGATNARLHTILPSDHDLRSTTIHDYVVDSGGSGYHVDYLGGKATSGKFSVSPKGNVAVAIDFDFKTCNTAASSVTPSAASSALVYVDTDVTTTLDGTDICQRGLDFTIPTMAKIDRDRVCPGGREEPIAMGSVVPTGNLSFDLESMDYLDAFLAGDQMSLVFTIDSGVEIETGQNFKCTFTFAAVQFTGDGYNRSLTDLTEQPLTWEAVDNGTDPLWKIEYQTSDTAA